MRPKTQVLVLQVKAAREKGKTTDSMHNICSIACYLGIYFVRKSPLLPLYKTMDPCSCEMDQPCGISCCMHVAAGLLDSIYGYYVVNYLSKSQGQAYIIP